MYRFGESKDFLALNNFFKRGWTKKALQGKRIEHFCVFNSWIFYKILNNEIHIPRHIMNFNLWHTDKWQEPTSADSTSVKNVLMWARPFICQFQMKNLQCQNRYIHLGWGRTRIATVVLGWDQLSPWSPPVKGTWLNPLPRATGVPRGFDTPN